MTHVINLYGGPGTGKTTNRARLFTYFKDAGINTEEVKEYVKMWAWEDRKPVNFDQFYIFGKQARSEYPLFGKVDYIITDSPVALGGYYAEVFGTPFQSTCFRQMVQVYYDMCAQKGVTHTHVFLNRVKPYNPKGRFQNEEEAINIDGEMKHYLKSLGIKTTVIDGNEQGMKELFKTLTKGK